MKHKNVRYEVWMLGYDKDGMCIDVEEYLGTFDNADAAIAHAEKFKDVSYVYEQDIIDSYLEPGDYFEVRVETIRNGDLSNANIDTVYSNIIGMPQ